MNDFNHAFDEIAAELGAGDGTGPATPSTIDTTNPASSDAAAFAAANPAPRPAPRLAPEPVDDSPDLGGSPVPPDTAFDLLDGSYLRARRSRTVSIAAVTACLGLAGLFGLQGLAARGQTFDANAQLEQTQAHHVQVTARLGELTTVGGYTQAQLDELIENRSASLFTIANSEPDVLRIIDALDEIGFTRDGVTVTSIVFDDEKAAAADGTGTPAPVTADGQWKIRIALVASSFDGLDRILANVDRLPITLDGSVNFAGEPPSLTVDLTGVYTQTEGRRTPEIATRLGVSADTTPVAQQAPTTEESGS